MPNREMLINYVPGEECRIAIIENGRLEELYQERAASEMHVGNIYKGRVINVEPSIQAAFIDFGLERNGFLHISDLHPKYFPGEDREETEQVGLKTPRRDRPPIQKCLRRGQEVLVQVLKEGIGTKGPTLTSYLSIPGRFLVMMPDMERMGVSRKVDDDDARRKMRAILDKLSPPKGFGFIIRTAGIGRTEHDLKRDLAYLVRLWKTLEKRMAETDIGELFAESDLIIRTMRDVYSADITRVIIDDAGAARRARDFLSISNPRSGSNVLVYSDPIPLFHRFGIEEQIEHVNSRIVPLRSGGSLVIDTTEALVAIDVNSGKHRDNRDAEMTAYRVNLEAADEICRQLRLRDLGGVIVNDLIDMHDPKHRREVENRFRDNLKHDRARTRIGQISQFGVLEMTRQRMRPSLTKSLYHDCPACQGTGMSRSAESMVLSVIRHLSLVLQRPSISRVEVTVSPDVAFQLLNRKRAQLVHLEQLHSKSVTVRVFGDGGMSYLGIAGFDARGSTVDVQSPFVFSEPTLEPVPGVLDDAELSDIVDEALIEETIPNEAAVPAEAVEGETTQATAEAVSVGEPSTDATTSSDPSAPAESTATADGVEAVHHHEELPVEALDVDDPLAAARAHYHEGDEVEAPDEQHSRPGFHGPRVVVPAPVAQSLITHGTPPAPPYRQAPQRPLPGGPRPGQGQQSGRNNNQPGAEGGEGRSGRRRRRRRRGRGGQGQPQAGGPQHAGHQASGHGDEFAGDHANDELLQDAQADAAGSDTADQVAPLGDAADPAQPAIPGLSANPTEAELDELADAIGNLKSPELIELARRRIAEASGQPAAEGAEQGEGGEGGGRRKRRRRRRRGRGRGGNQQGENAEFPGASGDAPADGEEGDHGGEPAEDQDQLQAVPDDEPATEPAAAVQPPAPPRRPAREPVPDLVAERLAAMQLELPVAPAKRPAPRPQEPTPNAAPDAAPQPPAAEVVAKPEPVEPAVQPAVEEAAPAPAPVRAPSSRGTRSAPKRPLPPSVPLFTPPPAATESPAPEAPAAPALVDPVAPIKVKSPIVRPPYRRKKAAAEPAATEQTPKPEA